MIRRTVFADLAIPFVRMCAGRDPAGWPGTFGIPQSSGGIRRNWSARPVKFPADSHPVRFAQDSLNRLAARFRQPCGLLDLGGELVAPLVI